MTTPVSKIIKMLLRDGNFREYFRLLLLYGNIPRYKQKNVKFLDYKISVPDCPSFIFQFKEIFVKQYYNFQTEVQDPVIYDCGANIGMSVLFFKSLYKKARIKAFEADEKIAGILKKNLNMNRILDVNIIPKAVWIHSEGIEFYSDGADAGSIFGNKKKILIKTVRLKDFIEKEDQIDLLKLDIEGAECDVLDDIQDGLKIIENLFIEYHSFKDKTQRLDLILSILKEHGFRYFINSVYDKEKPFLNIINPLNPEMDLQLNIFAYKN